MDVLSSSTLSSFEASGSPSPLQILSFLLSKMGQQCWGSHNCWVK